MKFQFEVKRAVVIIIKNRVAIAYMIDNNAQSIICSWTAFLTNAPAQTLICTQLSAGKLTNENIEYCQVNDSSCLMYDNSLVCILCVKISGLVRSTEDQSLRPLQL